MEKEEIITRVNSVKENFPLAAEDQKALQEAIRLVKRKDWKENLIKILELLTKVIGVGSKFFNP